MKRIITLVLSLMCVFPLLTACLSIQTSKMIFEIDHSVDIDELRKKYPEYFELGDFKGVEVYVWQMAENTYRCGLMSGTNRSKSDKEILELEKRSLSVEETKAILNEIDVERSDIVVIPIIQSYSSYAYEIDDAYKEKVANLFK